jgi:HlyD family secretion protein
MNTNDGDIVKTLGLERGAGGRRLGRWLWLIAGLLLVALMVASLATRNGGDGLSYRTSAAERGDLTVTVSATGTLQPLNQVEVGSELSGTIDKVAVDFNDQVKVGQVLAQLDTATLVSRIVEAKASLQSAKAKVQEAEATEMEQKAVLKRCSELAKKKLCSDSDLEAATAAYARARAGVASAKAQVAIARAVLDGHQTSLDKATIRSPINGIVLDRKVEPGQTVAASFQTPELFTLAEDLRRMELIVAIDEADIGRIRDGLQASFTVDAYPDQPFAAAITQVRRAPQTVEGVVSYETVLSVANDELKLLPGMTATAEIIAQQIDDALLIPNAALRYRPPQTAPSTQQSGSLLGRLFRPPRAQRSGRPAAQQGRERQVWVLQSGQPVAYTVTIGASDGLHTVVLEGDIEPGMELITESTQAAD